MRLSTRFGLAAVLSMLPVLAVLAYSVGQLRDMGRRNERLADRQLISVQLSSTVSPRLRRLQEYQAKYAVSEDLGYAQKYREVERAIGDELEELSRSESRGDEREAFAELAAGWTQVRRLHGPVSDPSAARTLTGLLQEVEARTLHALTRNHEAVQREVGTARRARRNTQRVATTVAIVAVGLTVVLLLWAVRSLRSALDQFTAATSAVGQGRLTYRMDERRRDELRPVAGAFNRMVHALSQLERMKGEFISSVSHELRTPIVGMLETNLLLLDEVPGPLTDKQRRLLELNSAAAQRLSKMIGDLLELNRVKAQIRYEMSEQSLQSLTRRAIGELGALARDRGVGLEDHLSTVPAVLCDPDRYVQIVQNLLDNAIKLSGPGGRIDVTLEYLPPAQARERCPTVRSTGCGCALLAVEDTGPGIPERDRDRVFERFFRSASTTSSQGTGLGLAICKEIVSTHEGEIWVEEARSGGARVLVALPCSGAGEVS